MSGMMNFVDHAFFSATNALDRVTGYTVGNAANINADLAANPAPAPAMIPAQTAAVKVANPDAPQAIKVAPQGTDSTYRAATAAAGSSGIRVPPVGVRGLAGDQAARTALLGR